MKIPQCIRPKNLSLSEKLTLLGLFIAMCVIGNPVSDIFTSGRAYTILAKFITEPEFAGIAAFCFFFYFFAILSCNLYFKFTATILAALFWTLQFAFFIKAQDFSGYLTWMLVMPAFVAARKAGRMLGETEPEYG